MRNSNSHQGVRSVTVSSSERPSSKATPGNRLRIGAGGTARKINHRTGSAASATKSQGAAKPTGPIIISTALHRRRDRAKVMWIAQCPMYGTTRTANPLLRKAHAAHPFGRPDDPGIYRADPKPSAFHGPACHQHFRKLSVRDRETPLQPGPAGAG